MHKPNDSVEVSYIAALIQNKLQNLPCVTEECCIYRVSKRLVNIYPSVYEPQLISIGPFHHGREHLKLMEQFKLQFLLRYLSRLSRRPLSFETKARKCYEDCAISMNSHDFVHMLLVDGCFVVEFLIASEQLQTQTTSRVDPLVSKAMNINLYHDLILLENQLPFFVLQGLLYFIDEPNNDDSFTVLVNIVHNFFQANFMKHYCKIPQNIFSPTRKNIRHLVDFLGFYYSPTTTDIINQGNDRLLFLPPSTTELYEAGVILEKAITTNDHYNIMGISFEGGVLKIPPFEIHDLFEITMRNLLAFENFQGGSASESSAIHYILFLGALISKEKDSSLLMKKGILSNLIGGSDEEVSNMFNNIGKGVRFRGHFCYDSTSRNLRKHCDAKSNQWMAILKRDYFNTPWTITSFIFAVIFALITLLQTTFTIYHTTDKDRHV
uniref:Uncharacterized protein n=2 Tax=Cucumis sativus TaxID=3659 RepID=A0A0A0LC32_CUCSA